MNRGADDPLGVRVLADIAPPIVFDQVLSWATEAPDVVHRMLGAGVAVDSPSDAAALHPELFATADQAKALECTGFGRQNPHGDSMGGMSAKSSAYGRPGRGRSRQRACWIDGGADDAKAALERAMDSLAEWKPD